MATCEFHNQFMTTSSDHEVRLRLLEQRFDQMDRELENLSTKADETVAAVFGVKTDIVREFSSVRGDIGNLVNSVASLKSSVDSHPSEQTGAHRITIQAPPKLNGWVRPAAYAGGAGVGGWAVIDKLIIPFVEAILK